LTEGFKGTFPGQQMFGGHPDAGIPTTCEKNVKHLGLGNV